MLIGLSTFQAFAQQPQFTNLGTLSSPRWLHATLEHNNYFYFAGGIDSVIDAVTARFSGTMDVYDANSGQLKTYPMPLANDFGRMFVYNDQACLTGGLDQNGNRIRDIWCFDLQTEQFNLLTTLPQRIPDVNRIAQLGNEIIIIEDSVYSWILDSSMIDTNNIQAFPRPIEFGANLVFQQEVVQDGNYIILSDDTTGMNIKIYVLDLAAKTWQVSNNTPDQLFSMGIALVSDTLYLFGGLDPSSGFIFNAATGYDLASNQFFSLPNLPLFQGFGNWAAPLGGKIYLGGGFDQVIDSLGGFGNTIQVFDIASKSYDPSMLTHHLHDAITPLYNEERLVLGGAGNFAIGPGVPLDGLEELVLNGPASTIEVLALPDLKLYPNPSSGLIQIEWPRAANQQMILFDQNGRKVWQDRLLSSFQEVDLSKLSSGFYWLSIDTEKGRYYHKISIKK